MHCEQNKSIIKNLKRVSTKGHPHILKQVLDLVWEKKQTNVS